MHKNTCINEKYGLILWYFQSFKKKNSQNIKQTISLKNRIITYLSVRLSKKQIWQPIKKERSKNKIIASFTKIICTCEMIYWGTAKKAPLGRKRTNQPVLYYSIVSYEVKLRWYNILITPQCRRRIEIYITNVSSGNLKTTQNSASILYLTLIRSTVSMPLMSIRLFATTALSISNAVRTVGKSGW